MHGIGLELEDRGQALFNLTDAKITRPRLHLTTHLAALQLAGRACGWLRQAAPERQAEPQLWRIINQLLDALDAKPQSAGSGLLAETGLQFLGALGWAFDFEQCVRCGTPCPAGKAAAINPAVGGLICSACGGAGLTLSGVQRMRFRQAGGGVEGALLEQDASLALRLVEEALSAHAGVVS